MKWYMKLLWTILVCVIIFLTYYESSLVWQTLEIYVDGYIHTSNADTIVNIILTYLITKDMVKECLKLIYKQSGVV